MQIQIYFILKPHDNPMRKMSICFFIRSTVEGHTCASQIRTRGLWRHLVASPAQLTSSFASRSTCKFILFFFFFFCLVRLGEASYTKRVRAGGGWRSPALITLTPICSLMTLRPLRGPLRHWLWPGGTGRASENKHTRAERTRKRRRKFPQEAGDVS